VKEKKHKKDEAVKNYTNSESALTIFLSIHADLERSDINRKMIKYMIYNYFCPLVYDGDTRITGKEMVDLKIPSLKKLYEGRADMTMKNNENGRIILIFSGDPNDSFLHDGIVKCSFHLKAFVKEKNFHFNACGICTNIRSFRFVKFELVTKKISVSRQIDIFESFTSPYKYDMNQIVEVSARTRAFVFCPKV